MQAAHCVQQGEVSAGRQALTGAQLAPGNAITLAELRDHTHRPQVSSQEIPQEVVDFVPDEPVHLDRKLWANTLRSARRGSSSGR